MTHSLSINTAVTGREKCAICQKCVRKGEDYLHAWIGTTWAARATYANKFHLKCFRDEYKEVLNIIFNGPVIKPVQAHKNSRVKGVVKRLT